MEQYFLNYANLEQQRWMVADRTRTDAFAKAIAETVQPGDVVIDVGAGTGILSLFAAKAGAKRVIGVERSDMAILARKLIQRNGFSDRVEIFHGNASDLKLDEPADVIISEWLGHLAYVEGMLRSVINVRDAYLKPNGILLPANVDVMFAPIDDRHLYHEHGPGFWEKDDIHGIDFAFLTQKELNMGHTNQLHVPNKFLLAPGASIHHLDTAAACLGDQWCSGVVEYEIQRDAILNGFVGWFKTRLSSNVYLDTAPHCPRTHWQQTYFPYHPETVTAGQVLRLEYQMMEPLAAERLMNVILRVGRHEINYIVE
jgi:SAM-dependent methyltransferase